MPLSALAVRRPWARRDEIADAGFYSVEIGDHDPLTYTKDELEAKGWRVEYGPK